MHHPRDWDLFSISFSVDNVWGDHILSPKEQCMGQWNKVRPMPCVTYILHAYYSILIIILYCTVLIGHYVNLHDNGMTGNLELYSYSCYGLTA